MSSIDPRRGPEPEADAAPEPERVPLEPGELAHMFAAPSWLRDLGRTAWLLVGLAVVGVGIVVLLGAMSTIVGPVLAAVVVGAVAGPPVSWLARRHNVPRAAGAGLVLIGLIGLGVVIALLVLSGIVGNGDEIKASLSEGADTIEGWTSDAGASGTQDARGDLEGALPQIGSALLQGVAGGISGLTSLAFFVSFFFFSTFFILKDGPAFRGFIDGHLGVPRPVAVLITGSVLGALRRYFLGVSIVALFNAVVVGLGALLLGVPLAGTIAVVTFVAAYIPFIGAFVAGAFAVVIALSSGGVDTALWMLLIVILANGLLQQVLQPIAFGATLSLNPLVVLIVTIAAGSIFGMVGLVLGAPLTSAGVKIMNELARARRPDAAARATVPDPPAVQAASP